ncbi:MAG: ROK family protein [Atopobiaceae bacterium]|jgi:predicted NBD/HSP70 family sugar kinase
MRDLGVIDIGGTSVKLATWSGGALVDRHAVPTPRTLPEFYETLEAEVALMGAAHPIAGVAVSAPGAPNRRTGVIESASAVPYIHGFDMVSELSRRFGLPVSIENDANCAALAELADGAGRDVSSLALLVLGTGVGGAMIVDGRVWHGAHLLGGEFGFDLMDGGSILSLVGTAVAAAARYNLRTGANVTGKDVFDLADAGDAIAAEEVHTMVASLARAIYNLQYGFDPERFLIGGGVSANPRLVPLIDAELDRLMATVRVASVRPVVGTCSYGPAANLRGAVADFEQTHPEG